MRFVIVSVIALSLSGCLSQIAPVEPYAKAKVGRNIYEFIKLMETHGAMKSSFRHWGWKDKTNQLGNGNWEYITMEGPNCWVHWKVNKEDIITGYQLEGSCN